MIDLGDRVKDSVTGFQGIVVIISYYLQGCRRMVVQQETLHEGKPVEPQYFDEPQLVRVKARVVKSLNRQPEAVSVAVEPTTAPSPQRTGGAAWGPKATR
jgi:hypothetical protein